MNVRDQLLIAAARVNEITLFRHFGSKDVLLREALARCQSEDAAPLPEEPDDPLREVTEWSRSHFRDLQARAPLIRVCLGEFAERPGLFTPEISCPVRAVSALAGYLERLKQRELVSASFDPRVAATMLLGVLFADAVGRDIVPDMYANEPEDAVTEYVALFLRGIGIETSVKRGSE
jgi:AcrR family transcriptional regulator